MRCSAFFLVSVFQAMMIDEQDVAVHRVHPFLIFSMHKRDESQPECVRRPEVGTRVTTAVVEAARVREAR
jgi:hypothetical protein